MSFLVLLKKYAINKQKEKKYLKDKIQNFNNSLPLWITLLEKNQTLRQNSRQPRKENSSKWAHNTCTPWGLSFLSAAGWSHWSERERGKGGEKGEGWDGGSNGATEIWLRVNITLQKVMPEFIVSKHPHIPLLSVSSGWQWWNRNVSLINDVIYLMQ